MQVRCSLLCSGTFPFRSCTVRAGSHISLRNCCPTGLNGSAFGTQSPTRFARMFLRGTFGTITYTYTYPKSGFAGALATDGITNFSVGTVTRKLAINAPVSSAARFLAVESAEASGAVYALARAEVTALSGTVALLKTTFAPTSERTRVVAFAAAPTCFTTAPS